MRYSWKVGILLINCLPIRQVLSRYNLSKTKPLPDLSSKIHRNNPDLR
jgi:hypothetical protein